MDIKLIDFGLAKQLENKKDIKVTAGSPEFVGQYFINHKLFNYKSIVVRKT